VTGCGLGASFESCVASAGGSIVCVCAVSKSRRCSSPLPPPPPSVSVPPVLNQLPKPCVESYTHARTHGSRLFRFRCNVRVFLQASKSQQSRAASDLGQRVLVSSDGDAHDDDDGDDHDVAETRAVADALARLAASSEDAELRREMLRRHYRSLVAEKRAAATATTTTVAVTPSSSSSGQLLGGSYRNDGTRETTDVLFDRFNAERARLMRDAEEQQLHRPNLDIPVNDGDEYITLAQ